MKRFSGSNKTSNSYQKKREVHFLATSITNVNLEKSLLLLETANTVTAGLIEGFAAQVFKTSVIFTKNCPFSDSEKSETLKYS